MQRHAVVTMTLLGPTGGPVSAAATADADLLAADLLTEAEHGTDSSVVLITDSVDLAGATDARLTEQIGGLPASRAAAARAALGVNGGCVLVDDLQMAAD